MSTDTAVITQFVQARVDEIVAYAREKYASPTFSVDVKLTFSPNIRISRGGIKNWDPFIKLACHRYLAPCNNPSILLDEFEYKHYRNDPVIGELKKVSWTTGLAMLVAHEVAHAIQFFPGTKQDARDQFGMSRIDSRNAVFSKHDYFFQLIYADLRAKFVNGRAFPTPRPSITPSRVVVSSSKKSWYSATKNKNGGTYQYYYQTGTDKLLACMFARPYGKVFIYNPEDGTYTETEHTTFTAVRRAHFSL